MLTSEQLKEIDDKCCSVNRLFENVTHRKKRYNEFGRAVIDLETYMDNDPDRNTVYNMVPFCASLVGEL